MEDLKDVLARAKKQRLVRAQLKKDPNKWFDEKPKSFYTRLHADSNSQSYGARIQNYLIHNSNGKLSKISQIEDKGDCKNKNDVYIEIKISYKDIDNQFSLLQIRHWQDVGYFIVFIDPDKEYKANYFYLTFKQMNEELKLLGGNCHGTKESNKENKNSSQRLSIKEGTVELDRWNKTYKLSNYKEALNYISNVKG